MNKLISLLALIALVACEDTASVSDVKDVQASNDSLATETEDIKARNDSLAAEAEKIKATLDSITGADTVATLDTISFQTFSGRSFLSPEACDKYFPDHESAAKNPCVSGGEMKIIAENSLITTTQTKGFTSVTFNLNYQMDTSDVSIADDIHSTYMEVTIEAEVNVKGAEAGKVYPAKIVVEGDTQKIPASVTFQNGGRLGEEVMVLTMLEDAMGITRSWNFKP